LGGAKKKVPVGMGIGVQKSTARLLDLVDKYLDMGFGRIKLKIKPGWDLKPLEAVRGKYPDLPLMVDANTAYDYEKDIDTLLGLDSFGLTMIEQPLIWEDLYYHALLKKRLDTPVCLDESIISPYGAKIAALMQACDIVNIKQGRVGGLLPSVEIHDLAQKNGIGCWVGQMIESGVGISYGLALASCDNCLFHNDTLPVLVYAKDDFIEPCLTLNPDSTVDVPQKPGLGVEVDEAKINHYAIGHRVFRPGK
jgi:O-succinylbenzoate synthase